MTAFKCLGRVLTVGDDDWLAVVGNLGKAIKSWGRLSRMLSREGADLQVSGNFYKAVSQAVFLFGAETWVLTPRMERALDSFQHRVARWITGRQTRRQGDGSWAYPPLEEAMGESVFEGIRKSITRRQNTDAHYIATRPILDLCERSTWCPGLRVSRRWWEQAVIDLEGEKKRAAEAETDSDPESDSGGEESSGSSGSSGVEWSGAEE